MLLPSKGLLSKVLNIYEVYSFYEEGDDEAPDFDESKEIAFSYFETLKDYDILDDDLSNNFKDRVINIHELMFLMKKWALKHGFSITTEYMTNDDDGDWFICMVKRYTDEAHYLEAQFYNEESEFDAVTKSCDWILRKKL